VPSSHPRGRSLDSSANDEHLLHEALDKPSRDRTPVPRRTLRRTNASAAYIASTPELPPASDATITALSNDPNEGAIPDAGNGSPLRKKITYFTAAPNGNRDNHGAPRSSARSSATTSAVEHSPEVVDKGAANVDDASLMRKIRTVHTETSEQDGGDSSTRWAHKYVAGGWTTRKARFAAQKGRKEAVRNEYIENTRRPNPFGAGATTDVQEPEDENATNSERAWGLSADDMKTINSITEPGAASASGSARPTGKQREAPSAIASTPKPGQGTQLTHVNSSGAAHMVDVGAKPLTKRVAIAISTVSLKPTTYQLIVDNKNKKGDALGTARIAGIMAAKRTSDLIPLCHPIAISSVDVDILLQPPDAVKRQAHARITARVECTGQTGVEMEALTAATAAALTLFDMCKAVDRGMIVSNTRVVYKTGGKSGTWISQHWRNDQQGEDYLQEHGMEIPATTKKSRPLDSGT
jgi:molybdenum cofactor biosynthesis protein MoaC